MRGERNKTTTFPDQPYLDGFEAIFSNKQAVRVQAIRGDRAAIEFRGLPPKSRDDLVQALGKDITVQESDWNCVLLFTPNTKRSRSTTCGCAARYARGRPLGRLEAPVADRHRQGGRRRRVPGPPAGRHQGGAQTAPRLLAATSTSRAPRRSGCCRKPAFPT